MAASSSEATGHADIFSLKKYDFPEIKLITKEKKNEHPRN